VGWAGKNDLDPVSGADPDGDGQNLDMGFFIRKSKRVGKRGRVNVSKSGLSYSHKLGPFTVNSRGRVTLRLGKGIGFRLR
jgi:hypothetical protein